MTHSDEPPIEKFYEAFRAEHLSATTLKSERYRITEHQVTLVDSLWQTSMEPHKFKFVNVDPNSLRETPAYFAEPNATFSVIFDLGIEVSVEHRRVTSIPVLVATVVGIKVFFYRMISMWLPKF